MTRKPPDGGAPDGGEGGAAQPGDIRPAAELEEIVENFPEGEREKSRVVVESHRVEFRGPIPPPEALAQYQGIDPEIPRRIMDMARDRQNHVLDARRRDQDARNKLWRRGQALSFIIAVVSLLGGIGLSAGLILTGHAWLGIFLSVFSLINTSLIFVRGEILFRFLGRGKEGRK